MRKALFFSSLFFILLTSPCFSANTIWLIRNGQVVAEAKIPSSAGETLRFAQKEFIDILQKLSGSQNVEKSEKTFIVYFATADQMKEAKEVLKQNGLSRKQLKEEGFLIDRIGDNLIITGYTESAVLYGMYHLLEQSTGFRFVRPLIDVTPVSPIKNASAIKTPFSDSPAFSLRGQCVCSSLWDKPNPDYLNWMVKNRLNYRATSLLGYPIQRKELLKYGMMPITSGHSFLFWLPPSKYFAKHPEYYSLIKGKRATSGQLCTSNPEVVKEVAKNMIECLEKYPELKFLTFCPTDGLEKWCQCPKCLAMDAPEEKAGGKGTGKPRPYTTRYIKFVNAVADIVCAKYPDVKIQIYAYSWEFTMPPIGVKPHKNVVIQFCPLYKCIAHRIDSPECPRNQMFKEWLEGWASFGNPIYIRDYFGLPGRTSFAPFTLTQLQEELKYFKKLGVIIGAAPEMAPDGPNGANVRKSEKYPRWVCAPSSYIRDWDAMKLIYYGYARLLWNPDQSVESIIEDFCKSYYGPAWEPMKQYYLKLDKDWRLAGEPGKIYSSSQWSNYSGWIFAAPSCSCWNWAATPKKLAGRILNKDNVNEYSDLLLKAANLSRSSGNRIVIERVDEDVRLFELWCYAVGLDWRGKDYGKWKRW